ncbi:MULTISPECIES: class I SAM-dependent methyltransferase [Streptococcus]|uniref:SAM-dependent methyltransferase n=2 Tax=Streptococcus TaxID=1301 RepID=A0A4V0BW72_9STRE|nr:MULTISPECIES: class I SAM-dependent methyltransferase [Streptococcus]EFA24279.1 methyltransferase domain protein [Streptococcus sp. M143]MCY7069465.1 class I SAM-dependent methyltransferase [Streptococcus oralis]ORO82480.1 SAM-dependent methyltransferase [Streptococcus oralis subsp. dentisani]QPS96959.1 class I SAM-dependent methyltransferase [Streptococcus oralis]VTS71992.1 SAM-dependent methyltransferase [Streptococcus australis]
MIYIIGFICFLLLMLLFSRLIQQSKNPSGFLGKRMMKLWNRAYLSMFVWAIRHLDRTFYPVILDVGVGNGRSTILLKETFPQSTVTGIDISDTAITQAKQIEMANLNFERRDVRETGFSDESFDLITAFQTHFHWQDLEASFMELRRILKSDGMLLLACEYNKLSYFLLKFQSEEVFKRFLLSIGFELVTSQRKGSWILYKIVKN